MIGHLKITKSEIVSRAISSCNSFSTSSIFAAQALEEFRRFRTRNSQPKEAAGSSRLKIWGENFRPNG
jgi:hypothetical protein